MSEKLTPDAFASRIKEKYPEYADVDNTVLANRIVEKYPEYKDKVDFGPSLGEVGGGLLAEIAIPDKSFILLASFFILFFRHFALIYMCWFVH